MFAGLRDAHDPLLAQAGRYRQVNGIDMLCRDQLFVTAQRARRLIEWHLTLATRDEFTATLGIAAGDSGDNAISAIVNGFPIFLCDFGGAEDAPADFAFVHS